MAERQTAITPTHEDSRSARQRPSSWQSSPFNALQRFADEIDRMFENFGLGRRPERSSLWHEPADVWAPEVEVFQRNNELTIRADLPGLKRDEVTVEVAENAVTIQGERKREHSEEREGFYRTERSYGSFSRTIPLPEGAITEQAKASFDNGVLEITMPTPPASKARRLDISESATK